MAIKIYRGETGKGGWWWTTDLATAKAYNQKLIWEAELSDNAKLVELGGYGVYHSISWLYRQYGWKKLKKLLEQEGVRVAIVFTEQEWNEIDYDTAKIQKVDLYLYPTENAFFVPTNKAWQVADKLVAEHFRKLGYDAIKWDSDIQILNKKVIQNKRTYVII